MFHVRYRAPYLSIDAFSHFRVFAFSHFIIIINNNNNSNNNNSDNDNDVYYLYCAV